MTTDKRVPSPAPEGLTRAELWGLVTALENEANIQRANARSATKEAVRLRAAIVEYRIAAEEALHELDTVGRLAGRACDETVTAAVCRGLGVATPAAHQRLRRDVLHEPDGYRSELRRDGDVIFATGDLRHSQRIRVPPTSIRKSDGDEWLVYRIKDGKSEPIARHLRQNATWKKMPLVR